MDWANSELSCDLSRRRLLIETVLVGLCVAGLLAASSPGLPMVWDEGNAIGRADDIRGWLSDVDTLSDRTIGRHWRYTTTFEGHPAFYGIVIAVGRSLAPPGIDPLTAWRLGPILLFGLAVAAVYYRLRKDESALAAVGAVVAICLLPRLFAHAHFASIDGPLVSCWLLAWATFAPARRGWLEAIVWGLMLGLTLSTKATGWIAPLPFVVWAAIYRDRPAGKALAVGLPLALFAFVVLNPPLWHHPLSGMATFFEMNLHRADQPGMNITTWFLGRMYNLDYPLPWYNTLFWTAVTVQVGLLGLSIVGLVVAIRRWRTHPAGILVVANWLVLLIARALPGTPPHDGVRLFLPSFAFLAILAGLGCSAVYQWSAVHGIKPRRLAAAGLALVYAGSATSLFWYAPQWLSYYNLALGGLPGATAVGMEPTYYWDALDRETLDWLAEHTAAGEKVHFAAGSWENLLWMQRSGELKFEFRPQAPGEDRWYVLQARPSAWQPEDRWLVEHGHPALVKTIRPCGWGPWRLDIPLIEVFDFSQVVHARKVLRSQAAHQATE